MGGEPVRNALPPWGSAIPLSGASYSAAELGAGSDRVFLLDQRALPEREIYQELQSASEVGEAIAAMVVRGAPAIGIAAAYAMVLATRDASGLDADRYVEAMRAAGLALER